MENPKYPSCFKCGDAVDMAFTPAKVVCEDCATSLEGQRDGKVLVVEVEAEHTMLGEDSESWN